MTSPVAGSASRPWQAPGRSSAPRPPSRHSSPHTRFPSVAPPEAGTAARAFPAAYQQQRHQKCEQSSGGNGATAATAAAVEAEAAPGLGTGPPRGAACRVRPAESQDYWAIADLHACAFYPRSTPFWFAALRMDRVLSLQVGGERQQGGARFLCLVAEAPAADDTPSSASGTSSTSSTSSMEAGPPGAEALSGSGGPVLRDFRTPVGAPADQVDLGPLTGLLVSLLFPPAMRLNYGASYSAGGLAGAVVVDTLGDFVPPKRRRMPNGTVRDVPRPRIAYLSNLAVAPCTRRGGIGRRLVQEAERAAAEWGCLTVALHVDPANTPALEMYTRAGYRRVADQPEWQRILEGRPRPLVLMMRALPWELRQLARQRWEQAQRARHEGA